MRLLALDIGLRRTGVAFADVDIGVPMALSTIEHTSIEELVDHISTIVDQKSIDQIIVGLPLLPSGEEGEQSSIVRDISAQISRIGPKLTFLDERYTTTSQKHVDPDASSACFLLETALKRNVDKSEN